jgi:phage tail-like protein
MLPQMNRDEDVTGELKDFVDCLQEVIDLILCDLDEWTDILDPDTAPEPFLSFILADLGNPFDFELTEIDKRRLISVLITLYKQKGTEIGLINAIRFFVGIEVTIDIFNEAPPGWRLGVSELGVTTILAPSLSRHLYSFNIVSPVAITDEQDTRMRQLTDLMKVAHEHLVDIVEPDTSTIDHWELGLSELGVESDLHE